MSYYSVKIAIIINPYFKKLVRLNDHRFNYLNEEQIKPKKYIIYKDEEEVTK